MRIGTVAKRAGVGVETIRFYERRGLIDQPAKPGNGRYRSYPPEIVDRIRLIRQAQNLGFSLKEINELLSLKADPAADCGDVRARAEAKLKEVNQKIARLTEIQFAVQNLISACPGKGVAVRSCSILDALGPEGTAEPSTQRAKATKP
jgi:MerR family mercuric resistance operon transcriptional regulator